MLTTVNSIFLVCLYENYDLERKRELLIRVSLTEATTDLKRFYLKLSGDYSKAFHSAVKICDGYKRGLIYKMKERTMEEFSIQRV